MNIKNDSEALNQRLFVNPNIKMSTGTKTESLPIECIVFPRHMEKTNVISFKLKAFAALYTVCGRHYR